MYKLNKQMKQFIYLVCYNKIFTILLAGYELIWNPKVIALSS